MLQRWLGTVLLYCEQPFKRVKDFAGMAQVLAAIEACLRADTHRQAEHLPAAAGGHGAAVRSDKEARPERSRRARPEPVEGAA